jgi:hypothetical protein
MRHPIRTRLVRPTGTDLVYSHDRMAKKKAPSTRSAMWASVRLLWGSIVRNLKNFRRNLGVIAFCRSGGGSELSKAFKRARMVGRNLELPSR